MRNAGLGLPNFPEGTGLQPQLRMSTGALPGSLSPLYSHYLPHHLSSIPQDMTVHPSAGLTEAPAAIEVMSTALIQ